MSTEFFEGCDINHNVPKLSQSLSGFQGAASLRKVHFWSSDRVVRWLRKYCNKHYLMYRHLFEEHEITGQVLIRMTDYKLALIGVENSVHREEILLAVLKLKLTCDSYDLKDLKQIKSHSADDDL